MTYRILVINPGGSSTRVALYQNTRPLQTETLVHPARRLARCPTVLAQLPLRRQAVQEFLRRTGTEISSLHAIAVRGGPVRPLASGTYRVTPAVIRDIRAGRVLSWHPSLLGALIGAELAGATGIPVFFTDPVSVDEFWPRARVTGLPGIERRALSHALNVRAVAHRAARCLKRPLARCRFVVCHLGTGITVCALRNGRQVDSTNANEDGPLAPERAGALPTAPLVELCFSGRYTRARLLDRLQRSGGLRALLGTDRIEEVERRVGRGDQRAALVYDALVYQVAKEIGAYSAVLQGRLDAIIITGGMAHSKTLVSHLQSWIRRHAPRILVYPGEHEMEALARGALRVLKGEEDARTYVQGPALG